MKPLLLAASLLAPAAHAATFSVTRLDDPAANGCLPSDCSLREAVAAANASPGADVVQLGAGSHVLRPPASNAPVTLSVVSDIDFIGAGSQLTNVQPVGRGSLFTLSAATVRFFDLTLKNAQSSGSDIGGQGGGAVHAEKTQLGFIRARLAGNAATDGGGVHATDSSIDLLDTLVESHKAGGSGGGIWARNTPIRLRGSTVLRWNSAGKRGGAIATDDDVMADDTCLVTANQANQGGGIGDSGGAFSVRGVATRGGSGLFTISANHVEGIEPMWLVPNGAGGGIAATWGATIERVALLDNGSNSRGGGLSSSGGPLVLRDAYLSGNRAEQWGGGALVSGLAPSTIERTGFDRNEAGMFAGALHIPGIAHGTPSTARLANVDFHGNHAPQRGAFFNGAYTTLDHVTFWNNTDDGGRAAIDQLDNGTLQYRNSIVLGRCTGATANISSAGTNVRSLESSNSCFGGVSFMPLSLARGTFGGRFEITGTNASDSGARDLGSSAYCLPADIRNRQRVDRCDLGAFEYGAQ